MLPPRSTTTALLLTMLVSPLSAATTELVQVVSREHPAFTIAQSRLAVGGDGRVYLASGEYVLGLDRDGRNKLGSKVIYALTNVAANKDGIIATANAHFNHSIHLYDPTFHELGAVNDFLVGDKVEWHAPCDVQVGSSGDFFAMDQNRSRIVRVAVPGRMVSVYPLHVPGEGYVGKMPQFRVWEQGQRFYILNDQGTIRVLDFGGKLLWSLQAHLGGNPYDGWRGGFDVDAAGQLHIVQDTADVVQIYGTDGKLSGSIRLRMGQRKGRISELRLFADNILVKRPHPIELFQVYDRQSGELKQLVRAEAEQLQVRFPGEVWTAGQSIPLTITFDGGGREIRPHWHVWLRPCNDPAYEELPLQDGRIRVPKEYGGLYQLKVGSGLQGKDAEYQVQTFIEIRQPGSRGSVSVLTPLNRIYYGRGEEIPVTILCRSTRPEMLPKEVTVRLLDAGRAIATATVAVAANQPARLILPKNLTAALQPGRYRLVAVADGLTNASQVLELGSGISRPPTFSIVQHGDYVDGFPKAGLLDTPDQVGRHLARTLKLGTNLFVDRLGHDGAGVLPLVDGKNEAPALVARLRHDADAVAPEKAQFENALRQTVAAYGANGIEQRAILLNMDAGLPVGTGFDRRTSAEFARDITRVTKALKSYPAFRGWSWAANWWINPHGAAAAATPQQKQAFEAALARAQQTGAWDPVLDQVSDVWLNYAIDAERRFNATLQSVAPGKLSAMTGPYRAVTVIPPLTFRHADEVDLHYQAEQIQPPQVTPHQVDFYKRPGKRAWGHPELWNDDGTGGMVGPTMLQMVMRGADGVGWSGAVPARATPPSDPRATGMGAVSIFRTLDRLLQDYGPWLTTLHNSDRVALVCSGRMLRIDDWKGFGGLYFTRLFEAYNACLYAHLPACFVFTEDLKPDTLTRYKAVLVVGQQVEPEPALAEALRHASNHGVVVCYDDTCRKELVKGYRPLGIAFDRVEKDASVWQDDSAYIRLPAYFKAHATDLRQVLGSVAAPIADVAAPEILLTERTAGAGRYLWLVNNTMLDLEPGLAWRVGLIMSQRLPMMPSVRLNAPGKAVYDVFALKQVEPAGGLLSADLRTMPARLYAILPFPIGQLSIRGPKAVAAGHSFRSIVQVQDAAGQPIDASVPVRIRLRTTSGTLLEERFTAAQGGAGAADVWTMPLNTPAGAVILEATELFGGNEAKFTINVAAPALPLSVDALDRLAAVEPAAALAQAVGRASSSSFSAAEQAFGPHVKDIALLADGSLAVLNAMNWDQNLYALDPRDGQVKWRQRVGHHFAYDPRTFGEGVAVQGFDFNTPEGYHEYLVGRDGQIERRFALYGLPKRATSWATSTQLLDPINNFAVAPDGRWVAAAGDLGLAVWDRAGTRLWSQDWWKTTRQRVHLIAMDADTLVTLAGMTATAYRAGDGRQLWQLTLARTGTLLDGVVSGDHRSLALRADTSGGRVYLVRGGQLLNTLCTPADGLSLAPDGTHLAVTTGDQLKWFATAGGLEWTFTGDDTLREPRLAPDGRRVAAGSELGTLYILDGQGNLLHERDLRSLPVTAWLADGDLLVATWMGTVLRLDGRYAERWHTLLRPVETDIRTKLLATEKVPTTRASDWGNAATPPAPLIPNLLTETRAQIAAFCDPPAPGDPRPWRFPIERLCDGKPDAPEGPWLEWTDINYIDSGWRGPLTFQFDTFHTQLKLTGITFVEDPKHPESWLRDMRLQSWDADKEQWLNGPYLLSDAATHTHWFDKPIEAARFRLVSSGGGTWPVGNLRLGEIVFHGQTLGASHPDVVARRALAVLFDEKESDLKSLEYPGRPFAFKYDDAYSGGKCLALTAAGVAGPQWRPPFGHAIPNWDFEIVEDPQPGQYRWLQFAWKATSPQTTGMSLLLGKPWPGGGFSFVAGKYGWNEGVLVDKRVADLPPRDWQVVRFDLWELYHKPIRLQALNLAAVGGGAAFDQIVLGRTAKDLPPLPASGGKKP